MHRTSTNGSYRLDRRFPGVGRIAVASGADTVAAFQLRNDLLTRLNRDGRHDLLRAIQAGTYTVTEVYTAEREGRLAKLTGDCALLAANLWDAVTAWTPTSARAEATRTRYATSFATLKRAAVLPPDATVGQLERVDWSALEIGWRGSAADWNHLRRAISHFLAVYLCPPGQRPADPKKRHAGHIHPLRMAVMNAMPTRSEKPDEHVPDLSLELFWRIVDAAAEHARPSLVTIAALGLRTGEYLRLGKEHLLPHTCAVKVPGTKNANSFDVVRVDERLWPWIVAGVPSPLAYKWLRICWKRALKVAEAPLDLRLHDLRHCYAQWLTDGGAPEARVQVGMRHATAAMTRRYAKQRDKGENAKLIADLMLKTA